MSPLLPNGIKFIRGPKGKKYTAILPDGSKVHFGSSMYQQYKDTVPKNLGGEIWAHMNHLDESRRKSYRARHGAKNFHKRIYSPAWFSYYFLW